MKNSNLLYLSFLLCLYLLSGCKKDEPLNPIQEKLLGSWEWIESSGGFTGGTSSPSSEGYTIRIEFTREGRYKEYRNNKQTTVLKYSVVEGASTFPPNKTFQVKKVIESGIFQKEENYPDQETIDFRGEDTLGLSEGRAYGSSYVRIK